MFYRFAGSGEGGNTETWGLSTATAHWAIGMIVLSGVDSVAPVDGVTAPTDVLPSAAATSVTMPSITPATATDYLLAICPFRNTSGAGVVASWTAPSSPVSMTQILEDHGTSTSTQNGGVVVFGAQYNSGSATGTLTATSSTAVSWVGMAMVVKAAAGVGEAAQFVDANTALATFTASSLEEHDIFDSATSAWVLTASATEVYTPGGTGYTDANTAAYVLTGSAVEIHEIPDAATAAFAFTASATEAMQDVDAGTAVATFTAGSVESHEIPDAATGAWVMTCSATEVHAIPDASTAAFVFSASATETAQFADAATAAFILTVGTIQEGKEYPDAATATFTFTAAPTGTILTDAFTRTTASDLGTASDGHIWVKSSGTSANNIVVTDHAEFRQPNGTNVNALYYINAPNRDSRSVVTSQFSVLTSQVAGANFTCCYKFIGQPTSHPTTVTSADCPCYQQVHYV